MSDETSFKECVSALESVVRAFLDARLGLTIPTSYEADSAGFQLMEGTFRYVNAITAVAVMAQPGSHRVAAWVLGRSAFEVGLTALWLTCDPDWKEREARWLGWTAGEEKYHRDMARQIRSVDPANADAAETYATELEARRKLIAEKLDHKPWVSRPNVPDLLMHSGLDHGYYAAYVHACQYTHGGADLCKQMFLTTDQIIKTAPVSFQAWSPLLMLAGWSLAQPSVAVLARANAQPKSIDAILAAHKKLQGLIAQL